MSRHPGNNHIHRVEHPYMLIISDAIMGQGASAAVGCVKKYSFVSCTVPYDRSRPTLSPRKATEMILTRLLSSRQATQGYVWHRIVAGEEGRSTRPNFDERAAAHYPGGRGAAPQASYPATRTWPVWTKTHQSRRIILRVV